MSTTLKYGVSLYSYTGDMNTVLTLEDAMAEIADLGATGIEILGEGNIPNYPEPSTRVDRPWHELLVALPLEPTNYGSWIDSRMWRDRDLTAMEGADMLARDLGSPIHARDSPPSARRSVSCRWTCSLIRSGRR